MTPTDLPSWLAERSAAVAAAAPPRVLLVAAHPDDETIGLGGQFPFLPGLRILHVTDGAPRDGRDAAAHGFPDCAAYAAARRRELEAALALAGLPPDTAWSLGVPDQEAAFRLVEITQRVAAAIAATGAEVVVTQPYEGGHPDHDATAFAVHAALRRRAPLSGRPPPAPFEMTAYHAAGPGGGIAAGDFLPATGQPAPVASFALSPGQRALKARMIGCFATQRATLAQFPVGAVERLRPAPRHDFTRPPHPGRLFYENHPWGMTGERFRRLAAEAGAALGLAPPPA